ncbi:putative resolvase-like protein [Mycobacterium kansasii 732]|nr:putative resolvase-like protein [Mycobacterium kansasii 732]
MAELTKIRATHLQRQAWVYVRQSTMTQVRENTESLNRQYELAQRAQHLGWPADRVRVVDDDLGCSGADANARNGFQELSPRSGWGRSAWCWASKCLGWRAATQTGITCWICAR